MDRSLFAESRDVDEIFDDAKAKEDDVQIPLCQ